MSNDRGVEVQIFGQIYHLKGDNPAHTREVARLVDERMNYIADRIQTADSYRIAVLTALHIADELLSDRARLNKVDATTDRILELIDRTTRPVIGHESELRSATG